MNCLLVLRWLSVDCALNGHALAFEDFKLRGILVLSWLSCLRGIWGKFNCSFRVCSQICFFAWIQRTWLRMGIQVILVVLRIRVHARSSIVLGAGCLDRIRLIVGIRLWSLVVQGGSMVMRTVMMLMVYEGCWSNGVDWRRYHLLQIVSIWHWSRIQVVHCVVVLIRIDLDLQFLLLTLSWK